MLDIGLGQPVAADETQLTEFSEAELAEWLENLPLAYGTAKFAHGVALDGTAASIEELEKVLDEIADIVETQNIAPTDERLALMVVIFSVYLGEVFRATHGGAWFHWKIQGNHGLDVCVRSGGSGKAVIFPAKRVLDRIVCGATFNVADYFRVASAVAGEA